MSLLTRGLGSNLLLTGGMGGVTVVIIKTPQDDTVAGASTLEGLYSKKRVKGITLKSEDNLVLLESITISSQSPTKLFKMLKATKSERLLITTQIELMKSDPCKFAAIVIRRPSNSLVIKEHYLRKLDSKLDVQGDRLLHFVEKQIKIKNVETKLTSKKTKHINPVDVLKEVEVTELLDILKELEDADIG